ncbi:NAD-dependent epimerase/dehydratase family protein [Pedobacter rhodius]|uniref:NAD(P)-dependent oxidoreductase n=1 Tax=Pedobacter rhodius TaxID=3004098 RepID=A0ABT4KZL0_9SPHI|nr:NAD(P)-dependent oxidoreductase [Pedobacter sp. SJ11]MCZ4224370.1 NAD(P)-dependent oxidoreductase [Pedobacter sp. SJ11]
MKVSLIGTNGLLSSSIGLYCNSNGHDLNVYGRSAPIHHSFNRHIKINLLDEVIDYTALVKSDVIIYSAGAGIQANLNQGADVIFELNVNVPIKIYNALKLNGFEGIFISFGSYFEIGENLDDKRFSEGDLLTSQLVAPNDYTVSKRLLTRFFSSTISPFKFYHFILPTIYGENESANRLIPYTLKAIAYNDDLGFTSGDQVRQYIYIEDVVEVIFSALRSDIISGIYNIEGVEELTVRELVSKLFELNSVDLPQDTFGKLARKDVGMKMLKLDGNKLQKSIDYQPRTQIADVFKKYDFKR